MKVAVLGLRGMPGVMGGVETHCEQLYPRIRASAPEFAVTVLARAPYVPAGVTTCDGVTVRPLPAVTNVYLEAITHTLLGLFYARFSERADVVHVHAIGPGLAIPIAKLLGLSVVFTHHGEDYRRDKWNRLARSVLRFGEHLAARFSDRVISVSRPVARSLTERHPALSERIRHIPNGATIGAGEEPDDASSTIVDRLGLTREGFFLTVARLVPEKGIHDLIDAFERLPDAEGGGRKLVIVGAAQARSAYADSLLARASDRIIFTGALAREDIVPLYANAAAFVLASYHEGLPIVALEALSLGARVLLSDIVPNQDLELADANYFPAGDVSVLSARLAAWDSIPSGNAGAIAERYDWNAIAQATTEVFREIRRERGRLAGSRFRTAKGSG